MLIKFSDFGPASVGVHFKLGDLVSNVRIKPEVTVGRGRALVLKVHLVHIWSRV